MADEIHEGKAILRLIESKGFNVADLARVGRNKNGKAVSWPAAKRWVAAEKLGPSMRESASAALRKLGFEPSDVFGGSKAPVNADHGAVTTATFGEWTRGLDDDQLENVAAMLRQPQNVQHELLIFIEGCIFRNRK